MKRLNNLAKDGVQYRKVYRSDAKMNELLDRVYVQYHGDLGAFFDSLRKRKPTSQK